MQRKTPQQRENRTDPTVIEGYEYLSLSSHIAMPKKGNRKALQRILSGDTLWDKRRVNKKAKKRLSAIQNREESHKAREFLPKNERLQILEAAPQWTYLTDLKTFQIKPEADRAEAIKNIGSAIVQLELTPSVFVISELDQNESETLRDDLAGSGKRVRFRHQRQ